MGVFRWSCFLFKLLENATWQLQLTPLEILAAAGCLLQWVTWPLRWLVGENFPALGCSTIKGLNRSSREDVFSRVALPRRPKLPGLPVLQRPKRNLAEPKSLGAKMAKSHRMKGPKKSNHETSFLQDDREKSMKVFSKMAEPSENLFAVFLLLRIFAL